MDVREWLSRLGLAQYIDAFASNDIDGDILVDLTADDLGDIGVNSVGHRRKLLKAIEALKETPPASASPTPNNAPSTPAPRREQGERRHLTVMFVDLVGSTALSARMDPEDWGGFIGTYNDAVATVVTRYEGFVAKFLGDGVLCYFGWPKANEDDAERSVRAGLEIIDAVSRLSLPVDEKPATRIGIASGLVVIGDLMGVHGGEEASIYGDTPNLAARLQGLAERDQIVVGPSTKNLLGDVFGLLPLGPQSLKGIAEPVEAFAILGENEQESRFAALRPGELTPIVGRSEELGEIASAWRKACDGEGRVAVMIGEAGIGKSRVVQAAIEATAATHPAKITYQCSPYHADSALHPIIQQMRFAAGIKPLDADRDALARLEALSGVTAENASLFAALLGLDASDKYGPLNLTPAQLRERTMTALIDRLIAQTRSQPILIVFEDLHWLDPTSQELLDRALVHIENAPVMILATARPQFIHDFGGHRIVKRMDLNRLSETQIAKFIGEIAEGRSVPPAIVELVTRRTDGVPLFVEELTKTVLESGVLTESEGALTLDGPLDATLIPNTLQDSLMARLDRLNSVKEVAQLASCIGREFSYRLLAQISDVSPTALADALEQLVQAELIFQRGAPPTAQYLFKHALVRDTAYESLLRGARRLTHKKIFDALNQNADDEPEVLAAHAEAAAMTEEAITFWTAAGEAAVARPAFDEGIAHFGRALELLSPAVDETNPEAIEKTLPLLIKQGVASMARKGWGNDETQAAFLRALELDERVGGTPLRLKLLYGLTTTFVPRGEPRMADQHGLALLDLAAKEPETAPLVVANRSYAITLTFLGRFDEAQQYYDRTVSLFDPELHMDLAPQWGQDLGITTYAMISFNLAMRGETDKARAHHAICDAYAKKCADINSNAYRQMCGTMLGMILRDDDMLALHGDVLANMSEEYSLLFFGQYAALVQGLLQVIRNEPGGLEHYLAADAVCVAAKSICVVPTLRAEVARRLWLAGREDDARRLLAMAREMAEATGEVMSLAEIQRLTATFGGALTAEATLMQAMETAKAQTAKLHELRIAADLSRRWRDEGRDDEIAALARSAAKGVDGADCQIELTALAGG